MNELHLTSSDVLSIALVALGLVIALVGCVKNNVSLKFSENSTLEKCLYVVPFIDLILIAKIVFRHWLEAAGLGIVGDSINLFVMLAFGVVVGFMFGYISAVKHTTKEMIKEIDKHLVELAEEEEEVV